MSVNYGLDRLHNTLLMMIKDIDKLCKENNITYFSLGGTTLGAARHKGFIPWDDDLDIAMYIDDYYRFIEVCKTKLDKSKYYLEVENTKGYSLPFSKIKLNNTTVIENPKRKLNHYGIFIDIFCIYDASQSKFMRNIQYINSRFLLARSLADYQYETKSIVKKATMLFSKIFVNGFIRKSLFKSLTKKRNSDYVACFFDSGSFKRALYKREDILPVLYLDFEDGFQMPVPYNYKGYLELLFGPNYMDIPEDGSDLIIQHNMYIDYDKELSYEEIRELYK